MNKEHFLELLARARANAAKAQEREAEEAAIALEGDVNTKGVTEVDMSKAGVSEESLKTDEGREAAVEVLQEIISGQETPAPKIYGVARDVTLNAKQQQFNDTVQSGNDCVLIGAAGTGKTTSMRRVSSDLINSGRIKPIITPTKWLQAGAPGAAILSYTRKAVNNIRQAVVEELKCHTLTIHKLLEYAPIFYEVIDDATGETKTTMRFEPTRNFTNPLPSELKFLAFEESSMISVELYHLLQEAMPHEHQEVFLGDIQQLPPIFGMAILGFKMLELPVIELTEVYRQALESPIINLAWKILEGNPHEFSSKAESYEIEQRIDGELKKVTRKRVPKLDRFSQETKSGTTKLQIWQKKLASDHALITATKQFNVWADQGYYHPEEDIILCPFNKAFGTVELNKGIAQHLGRKRGAIVHEVIAGFNKHYLAVGDRVLYDKEDAFITEINRNGDYMGKMPQQAHVSLDRWGQYQEERSEEDKAAAAAEDNEMDLEAIERFMAAAVDENTDRVQAASHTVHLKLAYGEGEEVVLSSANEINNLLGGYAITIHKAQGSEWDRVFMVLHHSYAVMLSRELLYTGVTRAKKFLHIITEVDSFEKGVKSQRIKGNTIQQKAEFFKGKAEEKNGDGFDISWTKKHVREDAPKAQAFAGAKKAVTPAVDIAPSDKPPVKLVDISTLVPESFKLEATRALQHYWQKAVGIWGPTLGDIPALDYKLQNSRTIGRARYDRNSVQLNPVWCIAAFKNQEVWNEMLHVTIPHEICHHVAARFSKDHGHGPAWVMAMKLMGLPPEKIYTGDDLPPWVETYKSIIAETTKQLEADGADTSDKPLD